VDLWGFWADWVLLRPDVRFRHTTYDLTSPADGIRATGYLQAEEFAARYVFDPPSEVDMLPAFHARVVQVTPHGLSPTRRAHPRFYGSVLRLVRRVVRIASRAGYVALW
jgi:hypothetical protein